MNRSLQIYKNIRRNNTLFTLSYSTKNPISRTWNLLRNDVKSNLGDKPIYPEHADIVIIGGGYIGSSVAYWLKKRAGQGLSIVVLEKDLTFKKAQNLYSFDSITQHFSLPENIQLSQYGTDFLRNVKNELGEKIDVQFTPHEYLVLASEAYAENLEKNITIQKEQGVNNKLLSLEEIQRKYPWIDTSGIKLGCISTEKEGSFNSWALLQGLVYKSIELGTDYVEAEAVGFELELHRDVLMEGVTPGTFKKINNIKYRTKDNEEHSLKFAACVVAAGTGSNEIAKLAGIGSGEGLLKVSLPLEKRQFNVYNIQNVNNPLKLNTPFVMDTSGLWLKRNGLQNSLICSQIPPLKQEVELSEDEYYNTVFRPSLLNRLPNYKDAEIKAISSEIHDCNTYDDTGILGPHAYHNNLIFASGFGRLGVQHAPGIGRAISELIIDCEFSSIDLTRFGFDRLLIDEPLVEFNVY